jgi:hypothetical protein
MTNNFSKSTWSKIGLIVSIAVLAFIGWNLVFCSENFTSKAKTSKVEKFTPKVTPKVTTTKKPTPVEPMNAPMNATMNAPMSPPMNTTIKTPMNTSSSIKYETFADGIEENPQVIDNSNIGGKYAPAPTSNSTVNYDEDVNIIPVEGTDLLAAPLADRMYYTNSIANVNRNASQDFRGDIPISYNASYTPFYQSAIYGEPMTINRLGDN